MLPSLNGIENAILLLSWPKNTFKNLKPCMPFCVENSIVEVYFVICKYLLVHLLIYKYNNT
jgi:hypothetical protein